MKTSSTQEINFVPKGWGFGYFNFSGVNNLSTFILNLFKKIFDLLKSLEVKIQILTSLYFKNFIKLLEPLYSFNDETFFFEVES